MSKKEGRRNLNKQEKKSRAKYKCPERLEELIKKINYVPMNIKMPSSASIKTDTWLNNSEAGLKIILYRLKKLIADLPEDFQEYFNKFINGSIKSYRIFVSDTWICTTKECREEEVNYDVNTCTRMATNYDYSDAEIEILCAENFLDFYDEFYTLRENVLNYVEVKNYDRKFELWEARSLEQLKKKEIELRASNSNIEISYKPVINPVFNKELQARRQLVITAPILIDGNNKDYLGGFAQYIGTFDSNRLRICEICTKLFWAKRIESETCSPRCFNNLRQLRYRNLSDEEKEVRKLQRQATKQSKTEQKNPKIKVIGERFSY